VTRAADEQRKRRRRETLTVIINVRFVTVSWLFAARTEQRLCTSIVNVTYLLAGHFIYHV